MEVKDVVARIKFLRLRAGLSARELSLRIDKNAAYISRLESEASFEPSVGAIMEIIDVCGSSPMEFFYYDISAYKKDEEVIESLKKLKKDKKEAIKTLLKK